MVEIDWVARVRDNTNDVSSLIKGSNARESTDRLSVPGISLDNVVDTVFIKGTCCPFGSDDEKFGGVVIWSNGSLRCFEV
jgi:hypothetical protein